MITFRPMVEEDYKKYLKRAIVEYAADKVKAGNWSEEEAIEKSTKEYEKYLPEGEKTKDNWLHLLVNNEGYEVGVIWYALIPNAPNAVFLFDFEIHEAYRRQGYATASLEMLEEKTKELGRDNIELHVFGHNKAAQQLYLHAGFEITNINMKKVIKK